MNAYSGFDNGLTYGQGMQASSGSSRGARRGQRGGAGRRKGPPPDNATGPPGGRRGRSPPPRRSSRSPPPLPELFSGYPTYNEVAERAVPGGPTTSKQRGGGGIADSRERPCRTLFLRNIRYETRPAELREKFERMGELKIFYDLIGNRGMVFVTYFDLRAAIFAKERLQGTDLGGRPIDIHFSLPKDEDRSRAPNRDNNQGTLFLTMVNNPQQPISDQALRAKMSEYGDVKAVIPYRNHHWERHVEFYDSRSALGALDALNGTPYLGGIMSLVLSWDMEQPAPGEAINPRRREASPPSAQMPQSVDGRLNEAQRMQDLLANLTGGKPAAAPQPPPQQDMNALLAALVNKPNMPPAPMPQYQPPVSANPYGNYNQPMAPQQNFFTPNPPTPAFQPSYGGYGVAAGPSQPPPQPQPSFNPYQTAPATSSDPRSPPYQPVGPTKGQSQGQGGEPGALPPAILALLQQTAAQQQQQGRPAPQTSVTGGQSNAGDIQALLAALAQQKR